jgi:hypothetical protein
LFSQFDAIVTDPPYSKREKAVTFDSPTTPSSNVSTSFSPSSYSASSSSTVNSIAALSVQERGELRKDRVRTAEEGVQENGERGERRQGKYGDVKKGKRMNRGIEINSTRDSSSSVPSDSLSSPMGDAFATTSCLLALASYRLKKG